MSSTDLRKRFDELIEKVKSLSPETKLDLGKYPDLGKWTAQCQVVLEKAFGKENFYLTSFQKILKQYGDMPITFGLPIIEGAREEARP